MTQSRMVPLGDYIVQCDERNTDNKYGLESVRGISINKVIIDTKANMDGVPLRSYKLFPHNTFCYVTITSRNGEKITLATNDTDDTYIVSSSYIVFKIKDENTLLPTYLYLLFCRPEFDRYARFNSWGSAREAFSWEDMQRVMIPLPSIEEQQKIVDVWKSLRKVKEDNEKIAEPLFQLCRSFVQELKHSVPMVAIGRYMRKGDKNSDGTINTVLGVGQAGFITPQKTPNESLRNYKIMGHNSICYAPPLYNILSDALHLYRSNTPSVCSPIYEVFYIDETVIVPEYLTMWLKRPEFKRYAEFYAMGVRNTFNYNLMEKVKIPLPSIDVQRAIVAIYNCATEAKRIALEADRQSRELCPALMQYIVNR